MATVTACGHHACEITANIKRCFMLVFLWHREYGTGGAEWLLPQLENAILPQSENLGRKRIGCWRALAPFECLDEVPRHRSGFGAVTAIERGLTAAGLLFGKIHLIAEVLQHARHGHSHFWKKLIDHAGNE
jgi:hypothetical protein